VPAPACGSQHVEVRNRETEIGREGVSACVRARCRMRACM
jgi:hypothetical protein